MGSFFSSPEQYYKNIYMHTDVSIVTVPSREHIFQKFKYSSISSKTQSLNMRYSIPWTESYEDFLRDLMSIFPSIKTNKLVLIVKDGTAGGRGHSTVVYNEKTYRGLVPTRHVEIEANDKLLDVRYVSILQIFQILPKDQNKKQIKKN